MEIGKLIMALKSTKLIMVLGEQYIQVRKHFSPCERISVTKQLTKVQILSLLIRGISSLSYIQTPPFLSH